MSVVEQLVAISASATSFTAVCAACAACADRDSAEGYSGSTFAGRLELDLDGGIFLCRRGHPIRVERASGSASAEVAA
jgi:hypothetical protein